MLRRALVSAAVLPLALLVASAAAAPLAAQALAVGERLRLDLGRSKPTFVLVEAGADTLVVVREGRAMPERIAVADIERAHRSLGRRSAGRGFLRGFTIGLLGGAAVGAAIGLADGDDEPTAGDFGFAGVANSAEFKAVAGALTLGGIAGLAGGAIGAMKPGERWTRVQLAPRVAVAPMYGGVGVRVGL